MPTPEAKNSLRVVSAAQALNVFVRESGCDADDALTDLLTNLMHWCDATSGDFNAALKRAWLHHQAEGART
jgi:hypothetical protein